MRLTRYINESDWFEKKDKAIAMLKEDCKPVLKEIKKAKSLIWRGASRQTPLILRKRTRKNRRPLNTHINVHKLLDTFFKKNYGWRARSQSVMGTNTENSAYIFGMEALMLFPIGKYDVLWKKGVGDFINEMHPWIDEFFLWFERWYDHLESDDDIKNNLNAIYRLTNVKQGFEMSYNRTVPIVGSLSIADFLYDEAKKEIEKATRGFTQGNLAWALGSIHPHELMFKCKEYYLVKGNMQEAIEAEFNL
jgi:hypothetical protein